MSTPISIDMSHPHFQEADSLIRRLRPGDSLERRIRSSTEQLVAAVLVGSGGYFFSPGRPGELVTAEEFIAMESRQGGDQ